MIEHPDEAMETIRIRITIRITNVPLVEDSAGGLHMTHCTALALLCTTILTIFTSTAAVLELEQSEGNPHFYMARALQQSLVQGACPVKLSFGDFKVDIRPPESFWHVEVYL